jgi:uncharacterized phiE125 gp8 family phage protein
VQDGSCTWQDDPTDAQSAASVPQVLKQAILLLAAHWFDNREAVLPEQMQEIPMAVESLCACEAPGNYVTVC